MVGFLIAGFAYNFAGLEVPTGLQTIADLGVTFLLFSIGLKLKLKDLSTIEVWGTSVIHILASTLFFTIIILLGKFLFSDGVKEDRLKAGTEQSFQGSGTAAQANSLAGTISVTIG